MQASGEVVKAVDALASKLAVPAQKLWGVLVLQARVEAIRTAVVYTLFGVILAGLWYAWHRLRVHEAKRERHVWSVSDAEGLLFGGAVLLGISTALWLIGVVIDGSAIVGYLVNPDYYALKQILAAVGK